MNTDISISDVTGDTLFGTAISQIEYSIAQSKSGVKMFDDSLVNLRITSKVSSKDFNIAKKLITDIKEMFEKYKELDWY